MRNAVAILFLSGLLAAPDSARADHIMVLVVRADSSLDNVSSIDLRKLYLGFTVNDAQGEPIRAATNSSNPNLWQAFLQNVMGMSDRSYHRRLLTLTLQSGRARPEVFDNLDGVLNSVESTGNTITFAWREDVENRDEIKILRVLWQH